MTVASQVKQAVASLKSAQANLETFALQTQDPVAKQTYSDAATQAQTLVTNVESRLQEIEQEEPQYKSFQ
ncbi:DUF1657 domain-containing protein [Tuberibacillus sp. Marseille-P3662]|uniref:DUF1657 domain-containing protein n=1 Tax=Tuberibacillus sp. Marseille-P3662 TaxID=1965358 RepID=UPI000A1CB7CD|nr:DUF1657 domain-containing protein [Tuberibacillus sp. Marseille-P3662]